MEVFEFGDFQGGWFVGDFHPTILGGAGVEVAVKYFKKGEREPMHFQKSAVELTLVLHGTVRLGDHTLNCHQIARIDAGEAADFEAIEDCTLVIVKSPSIPSDKVLGEP